MIKSILIKSFLISLLLLISKPKEIRIKWNEDIKLKLSLYRGRPNWKKPNVVHTATSIRISYTLTKKKEKIIGFDAKAYSYFYPYKSWYKKSSDVPLSKLILHEKLHFDIAEVYTRHLRKKISTLKPNQNIVRQLSRLYDSINRVSKKVHQLYDFETNKGLTSSYQKKWELKIKKQLNSLSEYANN